MHLVLFDMDHTLVPADSGSLWAEFLLERKLLSDENAAKRAQFLVDYQNGSLDPEAAYFYELKVMQSLADAQVDRPQLLKDFVQIKVRPIITKAALAAIVKHRKAGDYLVMITATIEDLALPIAKCFDLDHVIAGRGKRDAAGCYTGEVDLEPCMGRGKLVHLEEWLTLTGFNPSQYTFYSDSHVDLPLLEQVDYPYAVNPDPKLRQIAIKNNWPILSWLN